MSKNLIILTILVFFLNCKETDSNLTKVNIEHTQAEEGSWRNLKKSIKYKDFSLFIYNYPKSKYIEPTIKRFMKLKDSLEFDNYACGKYNAEVYQLDSTRVLFNDQLIPADSLKFKTMEYLVSNLVNSDKIKIPRLNKQGYFSKGHIHFIVMPDLAKNKYLQESIVQVHNAITEYKNNLANDWYGKKYMSLTDSTKIHLNKLMENKVSLSHYYKPVFPLPEINN